MILTHVWQPAVTNLPVPLCILKGIKNPREVVLMKGRRFKVQEATNIPKFCKLQTFHRIFRREVGNPVRWNSKTMTQKSRFLERKPKHATQERLHGPSSFTHKLETVSIQRPIGEEFRKVRGRQKSRVGLCRDAIRFHVPRSKRGARHAKALKLKQLSTKLRAGSAGANREQGLGITTRRHHSPQPPKDRKLFRGWGPPQLRSSRPTTQKHEIQHKSPNMKKSVLG